MKRDDRFIREIDDEFAGTMERMRRARSAFMIVWCFALVSTIGAVAFLLFHPEAIGTFIGRIAKGVSEASR